MLDHELWISLAYEDFLTAKALRKNRFYNGAAYHCQQSAEKVLKGFLSFKNASIPKTHSLIRLVEVCSAYEKDFVKIVSYAASLDPFSTATRYPDNFIEVDKTEVGVLINDAKKIFDFVISKIEQSTGHHQTIIFPR